MEMFKDVEGLKILACGGDGTGKWILVRTNMPPQLHSFALVCKYHAHHHRPLVAVTELQETMDEMGLDPNPPVAVLPLGTGNDICTPAAANDQPIRRMTHVVFKPFMAMRAARVLGWGGGYAGEKLLPILRELQQSKTVDLDR